MPLSHSVDTIGPLARSAADCALLLAAIAGHDRRDPISSHEAVEIGLERPIKSMKIALSTAWIERNADPEIAAAVLGAARVLRSAGATLVEIEPPEFDLLSAHCLVVMQAEASPQHAQWIRARQQDYSSAVRARLEARVAIPAAQYLEVLRLRSAWLDRFRSTTLAGADLYLLPAIAVPLPPREQTGPPRGAATPNLPPRLTRLTPSP